MVSQPSLITYTQAEVFALCKRLGHDPTRVARITIDPFVVVVEYEHPIVGLDPVDVVQHPLIKGEPDTPLHS